MYFRTGEGTNDIGASRYHIMHGVEAILRRLQSDHIDLYYVHRWDETTPIAETLRGLNDLVSSGKVRYVGASNYMAWQLAHANLLAKQTALGAARMASESDAGPEQLRARVTSKGGTTAAALSSFEHDDFHIHVSKALHAACNRSRELANELGKDR